MIECREAVSSILIDQITKYFHIIVLQMESKWKWKEKGCEGKIILISNKQNKKCRWNLQFFFVSKKVEFFNVVTIKRDTPKPLNIPNTKNRQFSRDDRNSKQSSNNWLWTWLFRLNSDEKANISNHPPLLL